MRAVMTGHRHRNRPRQTRWQDHWQNCWQDPRQNYGTGKWIDGSGRLLANRDEIAGILTLESGKPFWEAA
jgi:hypothetical protein